MQRDACKDEQVPALIQSAALEEAVRPHQNPGLARSSVAGLAIIAVKYLIFETGGCDNCFFFPRFIFPPTLAPVAQT